MARLRKKAKKQLLLIFLLLVLLIGFFGLKYIFNNDNNDLKNKIDEIIEPEDPIKTYTASLIATGDGLVHSTVYKAAYNATNQTYDFSNMLFYTKEKLKDYDIKYYNQETIFDDVNEHGGFTYVNTPSGLGTSMNEAGFTVV